MTTIFLFFVIQNKVLFIYFFGGRKRFKSRSKDRLRNRLHKTMLFNRVCRVLRHCYLFANKNFQTSLFWKELSTKENCLFLSFWCFKLVSIASASILLQSFRCGLNVKIPGERNQISNANQIAPDYVSITYSWLPITRTRANSNQSWFPLDFLLIFTVILPSVTRTSR